MAVRYRKFSAAAEQEDIMKFPHNPSHTEPANRPNTNESDSVYSNLSGNVFHPVRRASDTCPISRVPSESECPPTSPKIHELRERNMTRLAAETRLSSSPLK